MKITFYVFLGITAFVYLYFLSKIQKPIKFLIFSALIYLMILAAIDLTAFFSGIYIPINECVVASIAFFGIPAIVGLIAFKFIFIL